MPFNTHPYRSVPNWAMIREFIGATFGRLTITGALRVNGKWFFCADCSCGAIACSDASSVRAGYAQSCGCHRRDRARDPHPWARTHGLSNKRAYHIWILMRSRCSDQADMDYGGRGIRLCERWQSFENFYADMGEAPPRYTIERNDVNGHYEPGNCKWIPRHEQCYNRRDTLRLTAFGETKSAAQWLLDHRCVVSRATLYARIKLGWSHEDAIVSPLMGTGGRRRTDAEILEAHTQSPK